MPPSQINFHLVGRLLVLVVLLAVAAFTLSNTRKANALPCHEVTHHYYDAPDYANEVGTKYVTCNGITTYGTVTQYVFTEDGECCSCCGYCPDWCDPFP
jgi:hypothetical protein